MPKFYGTFDSGKLSKHFVVIDANNVDDAAAKMKRTYSLGDWDFNVLNDYDWRMHGPRDVTEIPFGAGIDGVPADKGKQ
jgi:hypothetical protein